MAQANSKAFSTEDCSESAFCQTAVDVSECLKSSVQNLLDNVSDETFISLYKALFKRFEKKDDVIKPALSGSSLEGRMYFDQFNRILKSSTSEIIHETVSTLNDNFKELEKLKIQQAGSTVTWRPPGNVSEHITPFEYVCEMETKKELEGKIEREREAVNILKSRLIQKRNKALGLNEKLNSSIHRIKKLVCNEVNDKQIKF